MGPRLSRGPLAMKSGVGARPFEQAVPKAATGPSAPAGRTPSAAALTAAHARIDAVNE